MVDAFHKTIISTVENTVSKKIAEKMTKLDSFLQSLPKARKIDDSVAVNLTFVGNPVLGDSSVEAEINGLFMPNGNDVKVSGSRSWSFFRGVNRMVAISIKEEVFNSATLVYFNVSSKSLIDPGKADALLIDEFGGTKFGLVLDFDPGKADAYGYRRIKERFCSKHI